MMQLTATSTPRARPWRNTLIEMQCLGPRSGRTANMTTKMPTFQSFIAWQKKTREAFAERYGGAEMAETILNLGVASFGHVLAESEEEEMAEDDRALARGLREAGITGITSDLLHTSKRILAARQDDRPFVMAFAGYSTTVGRGNYFNQSYPFVAERILREPMLELLGDGTNSGKFIVRNAGIGGIPSFPYGWCLENFLGSDADVVSWEFTLNEAGGIPGGLEAYVRHVSSMPNVPKLIVKDSPKARGRLEVLRKYSKKNVLRDAVAVYSDLAAEDFVSMKKEERPPGFKNWEEFGAPPGSPGQVKWHPTHQEHALYGWMIAMHILTSMELAAKLINLGLDKRTFTFKSPLLPRPLFPPHNTDEKPISVLVGDPIDGPLQEPTSPWLLNRVSCRTSFEPHLKDEGTLKDIVVSGLAPEKVDILLPKGMMTYGKGWVWDIGDSERKAKNRLTVHDGGLGFIDSKTALYGLPISGMLNLWLPWEGTTGGWQATHHTPSVGDRASKWFKSFVICEVNEKRTAKECKMDTDVDYFVGGASAASKVEKIVAPGVQYLTKDICVQVDVHSTSTLSSRPDDGSGSSSITGSGNVGLSVDVKVTGFLTLKDGACSISHVVWEQLGTSRSI
uniref:Uncharacterized protein n=1 Tax=Corethron hystrix TaxID=216773 RepID=A0A7S1BW83_9STRA|mmetsp:Transcript_41822/g.97961  ORF Transcript_41822/g.97961 Transcript_41822/m.97961 type:complete len:622 (+) Transcript_41822:786-2651(+)